MSDLTFSALWCAGQVALISSLILGVSVICLRRSPNAVSHMIGWAAVVVLGVTILIPCRWPAGWRWATSEAPREPISIRSTTIVNSAEPTIDEPAQHTIGFSLNPDQLLAPVRQLQHAPAPLGPRLRLCLAWLLGAGLVWSLTRLAFGLWSIRSLRRQATPLTDPDLQQLAQKMLAELRGSQPPRLAESSRVDGAAVVGFLRPVVLLSDRWRSWSPDELRAVLAHELAHVSRRDALWRLVANLGAAIHFYNPLLRGLLRRLILAQELVADRLAIPLAGGQGCYLRALSGLALRQDAELRGQPETLMIPVFSGHWLRRIEMLKAMDCMRPRPVRGWSAMSVVATIVALGLATTAMRAWAQDQAQPLPRVPVGDTDQTPAGILISARYISIPLEVFHQTGIQAETSTPEDTGPVEAPPPRGAVNDDKPILLISSRTLVQTQLEVQACRLNAEQLAAALQLIQSHPQVNTVLAPKLALQNGQIGTVMTQTDLKKTLNGQVKSQGLQQLSLAVRPTVAGESIQLDVRLRGTETIDQPEKTSTSRVTELSARVRPLETLALWSKEQDRCHLLLVDATPGAVMAPPSAPGELNFAPDAAPVLAIPRKVSLFKNPRVPASELGFSKAGAIHLDLAGLRRAATQGIVTDAYIQMLLELSYVNLSAQALDSLTANLVFVLGHDPQGEEGRKGTAHAGADRFILRANQDLSLRTLSQSIPDSNIKQVAGEETLEVTMPFLGPAPFLLKQPDPRTLRIGFPEVDTAAKPATPAWGEDWDSVSGGLITLLIRLDEKSKELTFEGEPYAELMRTICRNIDVVAIGIDIAEDEPRMEFQVRLNCGTSEKALQVLTAIQAGIAVAETFRDSAPGPIPDYHQMLWNALAHAQITRPADQQQIIQASTFAVLPDSMLKEMRDAVTAELGQIRENRRLEPRRVMPPDPESVR